MAFGHLIEGKSSYRSEGEINDRLNINNRIGVDLQGQCQVNNRLLTDNNRLGSESGRVYLYSGSLRIPLFIQIRSTINLIKSNSIIINNCQSSPINQLRWPFSLLIDRNGIWLSM